MEKTIKNTIKIADLVAPVISSRDIAVILKSSILKSNFSIVELDFSNVEFISRSAAHSLLLMKEDLKRSFFKKRDVILINTNEEVSKMLRIIAANRVSPKSKPDFKAEKVDITTLA
ncbi:MAG: STAS domain-containing protein [Candidatus Komeilibacteria bacterium]|nr:STAS domain-containing protein [Candidatus Komeilibacteria bacterium]